MSSTADLAGVPGVPETLVGEALLASLPAHHAPAPWTGDCDAVLWFGRGGAAATAALAPALRGSGGLGRGPGRSGRGLGVVGAVVRYHGTPVGAYDEVVGMVGSWTGIRPWGSVAFMAVDSPASLVAGRAAWAVPKTLAAFEGDLAGGSTVTARSAAGVGWRVDVSSRPFGPTVPLRARGVARQQFPGGGVGRSRLSVRGRARLALVTVAVESEGPLATWLRPGRHVGLVVQDARFALAEPQAESRAPLPWPRRA
jgi:hypothetical protein